MSRSVSLRWREVPDRIPRRWLVSIGIVVVIAIFLAVDPQWTTQKIRPPAQSAATKSADFDPTDYVDKHWSSEILPTVLHRAISLPTLLTDLATNASRTAKRYGHVAELGGQPTFLIKDTARIKSVNSSNIPVEATLDLHSPLKSATALQLGPILTGTDVRDAMRFISFNQFTDQVTYSELATAMNKKIEDTILDKLDNAKLAGKNVSFYGAFTYTPGMPVLITPVTLKVSR